MNNDIINIKHEFISHKRMPISARAAQFSPFAALSGFAEKINNAQKHSDKRRYLAFDKEEEIRANLNYLKTNLTRKCQIVFYNEEFHYEEKEDFLKEIDDINQLLIFKDKSKIKFDDIIDVTIL